ncbi:MAG: hypothetical protein ACOC1F_10930 [Myxococcota bacterium]
MNDEPQPAPTRLSLAWSSVLCLLLLMACDETLPEPGVVAPESPVQERLDDPRIDSMGDYLIEALASLSLDARVLGKERYRTGREADLSPYDLALGWGRMSDSSVYGKLDFDQYGRWYHFRWGAEGPPIPKEEIARSSANMHIIPATDEIRDRLGDIERHDVVRLEGYLVAVRAPDGWRWRSSLSRSDTGARSCEVFVVTTVRTQ